MTDLNLPVHAGDDGDSLPTVHRRVVDQSLAMRRGAYLQHDDAQDDRRDEDEIDLLAYWHILLKRRWLVLGVLAGVVAIALVITLMATPIYRATTVLQIEKEGTQVLQMGQLQSVDYGDWNNEFLQTQYELIQSRSLAERVANDLNLDQEAMTRLNSPGWLDRMLALLQPKGKEVGGEKNGGKDTAEAELDAATGIVAGGLSITPVRNSRLVRIHFDSPSPEFSARAANAVADGYIAAGLERNFGASSYAKTYLEDQLKLAKSKLEESERKLVNFAQKENLVDTGDKGQSLVTQNLTQLNASLAQAQEQRIRAQARWQQASAGAMPADMIGNSNIRILQQQKAQLQGQYQLKLQIFKPEYPEVQQLKGQLDELERQIAKEIAAVRASVRAEYEAASSQERMLVGQIASLREQALDVDGRSIQYNILKREVDTSRQLYDSLLQRYKEVGVAGNVRSSNVSIIDRAEVPQGRFKPSLTRNLALGLLLGAMLGVLAAFLLEFLDDTLKSPDDIEQQLRLPVLGVIPKLGPKDNLSAVAADPKSAFSEAYRSVRTALQFASSQGVPKVLLISSAAPGECKSTTSLALAKHFVQLGKRVLLIEGDLRNPSLARTMHLAKSSCGLSNLLAGGCSLAEATTETEDDRLKVILAGPLPPNPAELLSGTKLVSALTVVSERYDQVIIDGPPILGLADALILANAADGTLLMVDSSRTKIGVAKAALKRLVAARARVVGALLSKYDARAAGHGYGYGQEAYYHYGRKPRLTKS